MRAKKEEPPSLPAVRVVERSTSILQEPPRKKFAKNPFGAFSRTVSFVLVGFFVFNPIFDVYADELPPAVSDEASSAVSTEVPVLESAVTPEETAVSETSAPVDEVATTTAETAEPSPQEGVPSEEAVSEPEEALASTTPPLEVSDVDPESFVATTTDEIMPVEEPYATNTQEGVALPEEEQRGAAQASSTPETAENNSDAVLGVTDDGSEITEDLEQPTVETEKTPPVPQIQVTHVTEHKYLFRENECTRLEDGGFYCAPPERAGTDAISSTSLPRVFVENDGDKEIFFEDANGKIKITDNAFDDDAPVYDKTSGLILWHSLIKGRFQIMSYDRNGSTTRQITDGEHNNTDPKVRGKSVVWQGWVNNNWEIFYVKDVATENISAEQITSNNNPDMFPIISANFITWQSFFGGSWHVFVYNIENGQTSQINQPEASRYENPRFALLFENRKENGEVETVGYDVVSGKEIPINVPGRSPLPSPKEEKDQTVPIPAGQTSTSTTPLKNPGGKDDDGIEG